mmetsp:Transcript_13159/g.46040  ORF Transcript_13159/g.46040 Transcript_13159/m.46040 type:complete len:291 (+) Transcript_13159:2495-3367(+)
MRGGGYCVVHAAPLCGLVDVDFETRLVAGGAATVRLRNEPPSVCNQRRNVAWVDGCVHKRHEPLVTGGAEALAAHFHVAHQVVVGAVLDVHDREAQILCRHVPGHIVRLVSAKPQRKDRSAVLVGAPDTVRHANRLHLVDCTFAPPLHLVVEDGAAAIRRRRRPLNVEVLDGRLLHARCCEHRGCRSGRCCGDKQRSSCRPRSRTLGVDSTDAHEVGNTGGQPRKVVHERPVGVKFTKRARSHRDGAEVGTGRAIKRRARIPLNVVRVDRLAAVALRDGDQDAQLVDLEQ